MKIEDEPIKHRTSLNSTLSIVGYITSIGVFEVIIATVSPFLGTIAHALLIVFLVFHSVLIQDVSTQRVFQALILVPLLRILSLTMVIQELNPLYWNALVGIPLLFAVILLVRSLGLSAQDLGTKPVRLKTDLLVAASGVFISPVAYILLQPANLPSSMEAYELIIISAILVIFVGFTEEIIFRGILQHVLETRLGMRGILLVNGLFAITYIGTLSWRYVIFMGIVGQFFSFCRHKGSLWGVIWAHAIVSVGILLILYFG